MPQDDWVRKMREGTDRVEEWRKRRPGRHWTQKYGPDINEAVDIDDDESQRIARRAEQQRKNFRPTTTRRRRR